MFKFKYLLYFFVISLAFCSFGFFVSDVSTFEKGLSNFFAPGLPKHSRYFIAPIIVHYFYTIINKNEYLFIKFKDRSQAYLFITSKLIIKQGIILSCLYTLGYTLAYFISYSFTLTTSIPFLLVIISTFITFTLYFIFLGYLYYLLKILLNDKLSFVITLVLIMVSGFDRRYLDFGPSKSLGVSEMISFTDDSFSVSLLSLIDIVGTYIAFTFLCIVLLGVINKFLYNKKDIYE